MRTAEEPLFNTLMEQHHYSVTAAGRRTSLKYLVFCRRRSGLRRWPGSPPRHLALRDRFIGWSAPSARRNLHLIAYNTRFRFFLIPCRICQPPAGPDRPPHLGADWHALYAHRIWLDDLHRSSLFPWRLLTRRPTGCIWD
ncbi:MAG: DUF4338 domain-containing protein [Planctomycetes bacterium]|nr:DUF4338 domain-containing protein [Planctomycetota bacterium]